MATVHGKIRRTALALVLLSILSASTAQEPLYLGGAAPGKVINLDVGAKMPGYRPALGSGGFAAPPVPQAMVLDPGRLVHQAEEYSAQATMACERALDHQQQSQQLAWSAQNSSIGAQLSAASARESAASANVSLGYVLAARDRSALQLEQSTQALNETRLLQDMTAGHLQAALELKNQTQLLRDQVAALHSSASMLLDSATRQTANNEDLQGILKRLDDVERRLKDLEEAKKPAP
ncbi:MAG: hypothetical protein A4E45_01478 [Methanosaeta sp. PtaB.Bin039]|nr:MAG: hypothetical protein A4E45_01478 [Methanosaeta sp. PtaB.Bin039]HQF17601.1 hypothetical protein [Methanotrichaceae archaeon]HQI92201.1 hypothetical protein [Methanotrichaceae archaeon]HQJ29356.1 hypothetical protein [Methanotrichaceae archaeon]